MDWYWAMKAEGQARDHGTNFSNTQEAVELEVEFMVLLECNIVVKDAC